MTKYNVKKIESTNTMTTTLTTSCKKRDTAISRFCRFLSEYDSCFKDSMLLCTMEIDFVGYVDGNVLYQATVETDEYYMTYTECGDVYQVIIEFKHDENTTHYKSLANMSTSNNTHNAPKTIWCICNQDGTIKDFDDRKKLFEYAYKNNLYGDFETIWIEEKELKDEKHDYYETVDYEELDLYKIRTMLEFDICDMKVNNTKDTESDTNKDTNDTNKDTNETATDSNNKKESDNENKDNVTISLGSLDDVKIDLSQESNNKTLPTTDLIQYNIDMICDGLKNDSYKKVREGFVNLCSLITDNKIIIELITPNTSQTYTITKSRFEGLYTFVCDTMCVTKSPESFARWLYYHTFTRKILFDYIEDKTK